MHNTPNKSPKIRYKYIKHVNAFPTLQNLHIKYEEEVRHDTNVAAQYVKLDFAFDPKPAWSLTGLVEGKEGESMYMDTSFTYLM
jgi:hypothetical protein